MIMRLFSPSRVRNIFICIDVVFCASSRMIAGVGQRAAAHEGERGDLDLVRLQRAFDDAGVHDVGERVVDRAQIGIDLVAHVAGQETEPLAGFDRGPRQDDAVDLLRSSSATAWATASQVLPVPAGPMPNTSSGGFIARI